MKLIFFQLVLLFVSVSCGVGVDRIDLQNGTVSFPSGFLDSSFGQGGKVLIQNFGTLATTSRFSVDSAGRVTFSGRASSRDTNSRIYQLLNNGMLNSEFGSSGVVSLTTTGISLLASVFWDPSGALFAVGTNFTSNELLAAKVNTTGSLISSYATSGQFESALAMTSIYAYTVGSDGSLYAAGKSSAAPYDFAVYKLNPSGAADSTFGSSGLKTIDFLGEDDEATAVHVQTDGKVLLFGIYKTGGNPNFGLVRLLSDGTLDSTFGTAGKAIFPYGGSPDEISALAITTQTDGKILVAGRAGGRLLARLTTDGQLDATFGTGGSVDVLEGFSTIQTGAVKYPYTLSSIAVQSDGKVLVGGTSIALNSDTNSADISLLRYQSNGTLDPEFGRSGFLDVDFGDVEAVSDIQLHDGKILVRASSGQVSNLGTIICRVQ